MVVRESPSLSAIVCRVTRPLVVEAVFAIVIAYWIDPALDRYSSDSNRCCQSLDRSSLAVSGENGHHRDQRARQFCVARDLYAVARRFGLDTLGEETPGEVLIERHARA